MGIRPNKSGDIIVNPPDNSQSRWGDWVAGLEDAGDTAGGVVSEIDAKAESANSGSGELAGDLTALEGRVGNIADDVTSASHFAQPGELVRRDYEGQFHVGPPTRDTHPASKKYVDDQQHVMADITDLPPVSRTSSVPLSLAQRTFNGNVDVPLTPTAAGDAASKNYVDQSPRVIPWSGSGTMPTIPTGSLLLDYSTGVLWGP